MKTLDQGYSVATDNTTKDEWHQLMCQFVDASFYQTQSYGVARSTAGKPHFVILKRETVPAAMAQVRVYRPFGFGMGIAYVNSGPMWCEKGKPADLVVLRNMLRSLYNEYVVRSGCLLAIAPRIIQSVWSEPVASLYAEEGFQRRDETGQTLFLDLSPSLDEIRKSLSRNWRRYLRKGEAANVDVIECTDDLTYIAVLQIETEKQNRKTYQADSARTILQVHKDLPAALKLKLLLCRVDGRAAAALGWTTVGNIGMPLISSTGNFGLNLGLSHLLYWKMIEFYKLNGFTGIDLAGLSQKNQPGVFFFKTQILGKNFMQPDRYIGCFEACENTASRVLYRCICGARDSWRVLQQRFSKSSAPQGQRSRKLEAEGETAE